MKSALPIIGQWPPARRVLDIFQQLILPKTMYIRTIINFLGLIYHYKHPRCHEKWITLMASLILATMSVNSLEHIFDNIFFFSNLFFLTWSIFLSIFFSFLIFFLTWSTWCDRGRPWQRPPRSPRGRTPGFPRRPPRTCAGF